jgi:glycosyltransferase involved in cell wall biosynthesis
MSRIALLVPDLAAGGAERVMLALAQEFTANGHEVDLLVLKAEGKLLEYVPERVRLVDLGARELGLGQLGLAFSAARRLSKWISEEKPDVLLSTVTGANLVALLVKVFTRSRISTVVREAQSVRNVGSKLRRLGMRWLYPNATAVIAVSRTVHTELVEMIGLRPKTVHEISNPVDLKFLRDRAEIPVKHPWIQNRSGPLIVAVGRLVTEKDYPTLLRAFSLLPGTLNAKLIILGEGTEKHRLAALAVNLKIQDHVQLVGFDTNPWRWMAHADLYVISSRSEGNPNSLLEALALGLPAVGTSYDESITSFAARWNVPLAPPGDPKALSQLMAQQLASPSIPSAAEGLPCIESVARQYLRVLGIHSASSS